MRKVLLDTNVYSAYKSNDPEAISVVQNVDSIGIDVTVLAELYSGFKGGKYEQRNRKELEHFLNSSRVKILFHDTDTAEFYAAIMNALKRKGNPIPVNDIWIAASAMQSGLAVCSGDSHFSKIDGLLLLNPWR